MNVTELIVYSRVTFFNVMASGGLFSSVYITIYSPNLIIFSYWTQLSEYCTHVTDYMLY